MLVVGMMLMGDDESTEDGVMIEEAVRVSDSAREGSGGNDSERLREPGSPATNGSFGDTGGDIDNGGGVLVLILSSNPSIRGEVGALLDDLVGVDGERVVGGVRALILASAALGVRVPVLSEDGIDAGEGDGGSGVDGARILLDDFKEVVREREVNTLKMLLKLLDGFRGGDWGDGGKGMDAGFLSLYDLSDAGTGEGGRSVE